MHVHVSSWWLRTLKVSFSVLVSCHCCCSTQGTNVRMITFYELEVHIYHKTFFQSLIEKNSNGVIGSKNTLQYVKPKFHHSITFSPYTSVVCHIRYFEIFHVFIKTNACMLFIHFHNVVHILTKCSMMVNDLLQETLDTWKCAWFQLQATLFPHCFLYKKGMRILTTDDC